MSIKQQFIVNKIPDAEACVDDENDNNKHASNG